jgi:predicted acylesterase/phospholipase RssA
MGGAAGSSDPGREIRLALVLNGGVSLAVWMGGVTHEIDDLRRSSWQFRDAPVPTYSAAHDVYVEMLDALETGLRVDVIAGSSAGGINGAALGAAIGARRPLRVAGAPLRDLWVQVGDFTRLLRPVTDSQPESLLRGDAYMLPQMRDAFEAILGTQPPDPLPPPPRIAAGARAESIGEAIAAERSDATTIRLFVTSTAFRANERDFTDALGTHFDILDNRLRFTIVRDRWLPRDDFARPQEQLGDLLGLAARTSASFPVAFEPSFLKRKAIPPEMLVLDKSTYAMDGGVLDNEPFDPVLDQITQMPAEAETTRYLAYVVPYSNVSKAQKGKPVDPNLRDVLLNVAGLPRDEGIDRDFDRLVNLGGLADTRADANTHLLLQAPHEHLEGLAATLGPVQRGRRRAAVEAELRRRRQAPGPGLGPNGDLASIFQKFPPHRAMEAEASSGPSAPLDETGWPHGFAAAERTAQRALSVLRMWLQARPEAAPEIRRARALVSRAVSEIRIMGTEYTEGLRGDPSTDDAGALYGRQYAGPLGAVMESVARELEGIQEPPGGGTWLGRLWNVEVLSQSLPSSLARTLPPFNFVRMSADCCNALGLPHRKTPAQKLSGLQIGHFGGFLKRSWRVNDWIWGRLDGAWHLVHLLLDEHRISDTSTDDSALATKLAAIAFPDDPDLLPTLIELWDRTLPPDGLEEARERFVEAFNAPPVETPDGPAPASRGRPECAAAIAARAQLAILAEEAPGLWEAARYDRDHGWNKNVPETLPGPDPAPPATVRDQFARWDGARQTVADERSTSAFARLAAQAAVVLSTVLATTDGIPRLLRSPFVWMRGVALGGYLFVRSWFSKPVWGLAVAALLAAAAILTVLVSSAFAAIIVPAAIGAVVVASALLLGSGRRWHQQLCTGIGVGAALVACAIAYHHSGRSYHAPSWLVLGAAALIGLVAGWVVAARWRKARLPVFLVSLAVVCIALIYVFSTSSPSSGCPAAGCPCTACGGSSNQNWLVRLLVLATALPFAFGIPALSRALSDAEHDQAASAG